MVKQGQGKGTARKEKYIAACMRQSLAISMRLGGDYLHLDLTSGSGKNASEDADCLGSPIEFVRLALGMNRRSHLICCDNDKAAALALREELSQTAWPAGWPPPAIYCEDNAEFLPRLSCRLPPNSRFGSLVCDPNGPKSGYPREQLVEFATRHPRIDMILTFGVNFYRSIDLARKMPNETRKVEPALETMYERYGTIQGNLALFPRPHWWISNQTNRGAGQSYIVVVGRGMSTVERPCAGFFRLDSDEGRSIIETLTSYHGQTEFPFSKV